MLMPTYFGEHVWKMKMSMKHSPIVHVGTYHVK